MLHLFITSLLLTARTYMQKLLINDFHSNEYLFLYSIILLLLSGYICSDNLTNNSKLWKLSCVQYGTIIMVAITSIYMTQISFNIVKNNTVTQSNYIIKGMNLIMLAIVGKYLVNESLTCMKIFALFLIFVGILLLK